MCFISFGQFLQGAMCYLVVDDDGAQAVQKEKQRRVHVVK